MRALTRLHGERGFTLVEVMVTMLLLVVGIAGALALIDGDPVTIPGRKVNAVDTTGAGDCFAAAYITAKLEGTSLPDRLRFANAAAALATLAYGAQSAMPRRPAVEQLLKSLETDPNAEGPTHA